MVVVPYNLPTHQAGTILPESNNYSQTLLFNLYLTVRKITMTVNLIVFSLNLGLNSITANLEGKKSQVYKLCIGDIFGKHKPNMIFYLTMENTTWPISFY